MSIRFLNNAPALVIDDEEYGKILVVADIHLGIESELFDSGIIIAPQSKKLYDKFSNLIKLTGANKLVILGDFKHKIPGITFRELKEIPKFIEPLSKKIDVVLVKGNHDTELDGLLPSEVEIYGSNGMKLGKYGFFHGHAWPKKDILSCDYLFTAHMHPTIEFTDSFGFSIVEKVWVKGTLEKEVIIKKYKLEDSEKMELGKLEIIVFPAFNPLISGIPLNRRNRKRKYIGPLFKSKALKPRNTDVFMMDGTILGKLSEI